jgi:Lipase (class 3)
MFGDVAMRLRFPAFRVFLASAIAVFWVSAVQIAAAQSSNDPDILAAYVYRYADYYLPYAIQAATAYKPIGDLNAMRDAGLGAEVDYAVQSAIPGSQEELRGHARKIFKPWRYQFGSDSYLSCIDSTDDACKAAYERRGWDFGSGPTYQVWARTRAAARGACSEVSIAFRGTVGLSGGDWFSNLSRFGSPYDDYYHQLQRNIDAIMRQIQSLDCYKRAGTKPQIVSTGHSLGAGLAQFVALATKSGGSRIVKVLAFDPSPVTGAHLVDKTLLTENAKRLVIDRIYESGEILSYARGAIQEYPQARSRCNPQVRTVEVKAARGSAIGLHGIELLATNLADLTYNEGDPLGYHAPATMVGNCDIIYRPDTDEEMIARSGRQRFGALRRVYARGAGRVVASYPADSVRPAAVARLSSRKLSGPGPGGTVGTASDAFAVAAGGPFGFAPLPRAK